MQWEWLAIDDEHRKALGQGCAPECDGRPLIGVVAVGGTLFCAYWSQELGWKIVEKPE